MNFLSSPNLKSSPSPPLVETSVKKECCAKNSHAFNPLGLTRCLRRGINREKQIPGYFYSAVMGSRAIQRREAKFFPFKRIKKVEN